MYCLQAYMYLGISCLHSSLYLLSQCICNVASLPYHALFLHHKFMDNTHSSAQRHHSLQKYVRMYMLHVFALAVPKGQSSAFFSVTNPHTHVRTCIMEYGTTPYVGKARGKMATTCNVYKIVCSELCSRCSHKPL